jgi:hypothetical protein
MKTKITRYMPFSAFVSFLNEGLFVPSAISFEDKWEGRLPLARIKSEHHEDYIRMYDQVSPWTYISCWHNSNHESYAMWKIYGRTTEAVSIDTSIQKLQDAYMDNYQSSLAYLESVHYVAPDDCDQIVLPKAVRRFSNPPSQVSGGEHFPILLFFLMKHIGFKFENEIRLVILDHMFNKLVKNNKRVIYITIGDINDFIENVKVSPGSPVWFKEAVNGLLSKYGINLNVKVSSLECRFCDG